MNGAAPQKSVELVLLEEVRSDVKDIQKSLSRVDKENLILRTRVTRIAVDVSAHDELLTEHEKKINRFIGGSVVVWTVLGLAIKFWEKLKGVFA